MTTVVQTVRTGQREYNIVMTRAELVQVLFFCIFERQQLHK